jgi:nucleotide-binding universal stress UspA family protein
MNTILVPADLSETSSCAARYAAHLANSVADSQLILYYVPDRIEAGSDGTPLDSDEKATHQVMELALGSVKTELEGITTVPISIAVQEPDDFVDSLERYLRHNNIQLVVMGITGGSRLEQMLVSSDTLKLIERQTIPVMIVPQKAEFTGAKNIMVISDFKNVEKTIPLHDLKSVLYLFGGDLHIVNVNEQHYVQLTPEYQTERDKLEAMLKEYNPEFYFIRMYNFMEAINQFVLDKKIDLIITFPKHHSFMSHFFKTTHTSMLAYQSHVPIIAVHS